MPMTSERAALLGELLGELAQDPRGFIPNEAWATAQKAFALPYLELGIVRRNEQGIIETLLTHRTDKDWDGWHIPGGLWRTVDTLEVGVQKIAKAEIPDVTLEILVKGGWEKWHDHPYGYPISHIVICKASGITETEKRTWFSSVPHGLINDGGHHHRFISEVLRRAQQLI